MSEKPLFSVIMPNYNNSKYIKEAIGSVLKQTYKNWELVIVDDASTDDSIKAIEPYLKDKRINLIKNKINKGAAYTSRVAVDNSSGEIIGTLDSDDVLHKDALKIMVRAHLDNPDHGLIYSNQYHCDENLKIISKAKYAEEIPKGIALRYLFLNAKNAKERPSVHFRTFKKSAYDKTEGYDVNLRACIDWDLYSKLSKITKIKGINRYFYYRRFGSAIGLYRNNLIWNYYRLLYCYKDVGRQFNLKLPFLKGKNFSPFLMNIRYFYLKKYLNISKKEFKNLFLNMGYFYKKTNKLKALYYYLNSMIYEYDPIQLKAIKELFIPRYYRR